MGQDIAHILALFFITAFFVWGMTILFMAHRDTDKYTKELEKPVKTADQRAEALAKQALKVEETLKKVYGSDFYSDTAEKKTRRMALGKHPAPTDEQLMDSYAAAIPFLVTAVQELAEDNLEKSGEIKALERRRREKEKEYQVLMARLDLFESRFNSQLEPNLD